MDLTIAGWGSPGLRAELFCKVRDCLGQTPFSEMVLRGQVLPQSGSVPWRRVSITKDIMALATPQFAALFVDYPFHSQTGVTDQWVLAKLIDPCSSLIWLITEYEPTTHTAFGYVRGLYAYELGVFPLAELETWERPRGLEIAPDPDFQPMLFSAALAHLAGGDHV